MNTAETFTFNDLKDKAQRVSDHYTKYVNSPFLRKALSLISIDTRYENTIKNFIRMVGAGLTYDFVFFYEASLAFAVFCDQAFYKVAPGLSQTLLNRSEIAKLRLNPSEEAMCKILVDSFPSNIKVLAKLTSEMYQITVDLDTLDSASNVKRPPIYTQVKDLEKIDALLLPILSTLE